MNRIVLDVTKCVGCRVCEGVYSLANEGQANPVLSRIKPVRTIRDGILYSVPVFCQQCEVAACQQVCPRAAIRRDERGVVCVDEQKCAGCKLCEMACPVGAITVNPEKHVAIKCNQCLEFGEPQCVKHCYSKALQYLAAEKAGKARANAAAEKFIEMAGRA
jgi:anaerobic carbon-monoxide dehydrogenase iron sulfur subunit